MCGRSKFLAWSRGTLDARRTHNRTVKLTFGGAGI